MGDAWLRRAGPPNAGIRRPEPLRHVALSVRTASLGPMSSVTAVAPASSRFGNLRHTALSAFWFGNFFLWQPLTTVVIQNQIDAVVPKANQGTASGLAVSVGGLFAMTIPALVGAISDRLNTPFGRRRTIMVGATLLTLP